jgi:hypothetical protein
MIDANVRRVLRAGMNTGKLSRAHGTGTASLDPIASKPYCLADERAFSRTFEKG